MKHLGPILRSLLVTFTVALVSICHARYLDGQGSCYVGGYLYTAQAPYLNSGSGNVFLGVLRVSKVNTSGTASWTTNIPVATGCTYLPDTLTLDQSLVRVDANGNVWTATLLKNVTTNVQEYQVTLLNSSGVVQSTWYFSPGGALGRPFGFANLSGSSPHFFLACNYTVPSSSYVCGVISSWTSSGMATSSPVVTATSQYMIMDDMIWNPVNQGLILSGCSASGTGLPYMALNKYETSDTALTVIGQIQVTLPHMYNPDAGTVGGRTGTGFLSVDSSTGNTTYLSAISKLATEQGYFMQVDSAAQGLIQAGTTTFAPSTTMTDSNGDVVVVCPPSAWTGSAPWSNYYTIAKLSGTALNSTLWSYTVSSGTSTLRPTMVTQDAGGDYLVPDPEISSNVEGVERFDASTGSYVGTYVANRGTNNIGLAAYASTTSGTFYVTGIGNVGSGYYPLTFEFNGYSSVPWYYCPNP